MLKQLLYLYNDGHNPFPSMGQGGLGYHLPQYRKRMHGEALHIYKNADGSFEVIDDYNYEDKNIYSNEEGLPRGLVDEEETKQQPDVLIEAIERKIEEDKQKKESDKKILEEERLLQALDEFNNPDTGLISEIQGELYDRMTPEHKLSILYSLVEHTSADEYLKAVGAYSFFKNKLNELLDEQNLTLQEFEELNPDDNEEIIKEDIIDIKNNNLKLKDPNISQTEINKVIKSNTELILKHKKKLINDATEEVRQKMISKGNLNPTKQDLSGKGFEQFLCSTGESLVYKSVGQIGKVNNFDDHNLIPSDKQKYGVVDLFIDNGIIECKDYKETDMNDGNTFNIQESKLIGNISFNIFFEKLGTDNYVVSNILYNGRPLLNPTQQLNKYILLVNASDGIYKYDFLKDRDFVNDANMINVGSNIYKFTRKNIPMTMDYVSGGKSPVKSLRIDKNKFKKLK